MKKISTCLIAVLLILSFTPLQLKGEATPTVLVSDQSAEAKAKVLLTRLDEISAMDKSSLRSSEKSALRKEVREIKGELKELDDKVYLSVGAIIIIVLLLIILL